MPNDAPVGAERALMWSEVIEKSSSALPRRRSIVPGRRQRRFLCNDRIAFVHGLEATTPVPFGGLFIHPRTGKPMITTDGLRELTSTSAADVSMPGSVRRRQFRFRSYFLDSAPDQGATTLVAHERTGTAPAPLVQGTKVVAELRGKIPFVVPRIIDQGEFRKPLPGGGRADWVVESLLDGAPVKAERADDTVTELIDMLAAVWPRWGIDHNVLPTEKGDRAREEFARLVEEPPDGAWPASVDRVGLGRRVAALLDSEARLTVGLTHGDPGLGNVLHLTDDQFALIDWEHAGRRPVAHDIVKAVMSAPNPISLLSTLHTPATLKPAMNAAGAAPWTTQVAIGLAQFFVGWRYRHRNAVQRKTEKANLQRLRRMIGVLSQLVDGSSTRT